MKPNTIELDEQGIFCYEAHGKPHEECDRVYFKPLSAMLVKTLIETCKPIIYAMEHGKPYPVPEWCEVQIIDREWSSKLTSGSFIQYDTYAILKPIEKCPTCGGMHLYHRQHE